MMKNKMNIPGIMMLLMLLFVSTSFSPVPTAINKEKGIQFEEMSFQEALKMAKKENKLIFLDAYAVWCGPCKMLDKMTFSSEKVGNVFNKNFINLRIDMEKGEGLALARKYQVTAYPTMFIINPNGKIEKRLIGFMQEQQLLEEVKEYVK